MKVKFEIYIEKLHYYQKVFCVKTFLEVFFFTFCAVYFQSMDFTIENSKLLLCLRNSSEI